MNSKGTLPIASNSGADGTTAVTAKANGASDERKEFVLNMMGEFNKKVDAMKSKQGTDPVAHD